ncbi:cupin domain-containing protein [Shewanella violacea]|nr:cupin [Shewanella violacea]
MNKSNFFDKIPEDLTDEAFEQIGGNDKILIERIVSKAHVTPEGQWYDQDRSEWVMVYTNLIKYLLSSEPLRLFNSRRIDVEMVIPF